MISIHTNLSALVAQRNLKSSTDLLNQAIERMSTGNKINHAKDNAANYSISNNMTTKIGSYRIAEENVSMGLDMLTTANDSLSKIETSLNRLRALATQASNGTYGEQSKNAINAEANALVDEIGRLCNNTEYNGIKLFETETSNANMPKAGADGFIKSVEKQDTSALAKLAEVDPEADLADGTYSISSDIELAKLAQMTNDGYISAGDKFILANDIDLTEWCADNIDDGGWTPIGNNTNKFLGTFDGNGYKISNLKINRSGENFQGLFGRTDGSSIIQNLGVTNVEIISDSSCNGAIVGGVINNTNTLIDNCYSTGKIKGLNCLGGIVGQGGSITNSYSSCSIDASGTQCGGLSGQLIDNSTVENCYATGSVYASDSCGGLLGVVGANSTITNCYATGNVKSSSSSNSKAGGLIGYFKDGSVTNCFALGNINASGQVVGGLIGISGTNATNVIIDTCYAVGNVNGTVHVGGLIGVVGGTSTEIRASWSTGNVNGTGAVGGFIGNSQGSLSSIINSYSTGNVSGIGHSIGGFIGQGLYDMNVSSCYSTGNVSSSAYNIGGFAGYVDRGTAVFENCYTKSSVSCECLDSAGFIGYMGGSSTLTMKNCSVLGGLNNTCAIFLSKNSTQGTLTMESCKYNSELISANMPLVVNANLEDITDDTIRNAVSTCGFITPFDFSNDIKIGLQVGTDSTQNSRIDLTTNLELSYLNNLRMIGKSDGDLVTAVDSLLASISKKQTEFGAVQNRLESVLEEIDIKYENLVSSRSTIRDADIAEVSSTYIQQQILQQASATLLSTANQTPAIALQLL